jgi:hypothetical protein
MKLDTISNTEDVYRPYLRITNSYNSTHALKFRIGFVRWACRNGVVFDEEVVDVNLPHTKQVLDAEDLAETVELEADVQGLRALEKQFAEHIDRLHWIKIPRYYASPVAARALDLRFDVNAKKAKRRNNHREKAKAFDDAIQALVEKYYKEMGPHAYAMFNVITDYATHAKRTNERLKVDTYQRRAGQWLHSFSDQYADKRFGLDNYVADELEMFATIR